MFKWTVKNKYNYLVDKHEHKATINDNELLESIKLECDPELIKSGRIDNGANQVGIIGGLIEEAGKRRLYNAAPFIVEYCAWPKGNDFWVHLVPIALRALKSIGDISIIQRLREISEYNGVGNHMINSSCLTLLGENTEYVSSKSETAKNIAEDIPLIEQLQIVKTAVDFKILNNEDVMRWADKRIEINHEISPSWLCDMAISGSVEQSDFPDIPVSKTEQIIEILIFGYQLERLSLPEVLTRLFFYKLDIVNDNTTYLVLAAANEWAYQEESVTFKRYISNMTENFTQQEENVIDLWETPEKLDIAGKMLYKRIIGLFDMVFRKNSAVNTILELVMPKVL